MSVENGASDVWGKCSQYLPTPHPGEQLAEIPVRGDVVLGNILYPRLYIYEYLVIDNPQPKIVGTDSFLWSSPG